MKHPAAVAADYYRRRALLPPDTADCLEYVLKAFLNELSKLLLYIVLFALLGTLPRFLVCYAVFVTVRLFAGGLHCKTYWGCFFLSLLMIAPCVYLPLLSANAAWLLPVAVVSCIMPPVFSPVTPSFRLIRREDRRLILKALAVALCAAWIVVACLLPDTLMAATILYSLVLLNGQLFIPKLKEVKIHEKDACHHR